MASRPKLQSRVVKLDNAKHGGGLRKVAPMGICWHETDGGTAKSTMDWLNSPQGKKASYHYIIDRDGKINRFRSAMLVAWHAGVNCVPGPHVPAKLIYKKSVNWSTIGVAFANRVFGEQLTLLQLESGLWLGQVLNESYPTIQTHFGHKEVAPGYKHDPRELNMDRFRTAIKAPWPNDIKDLLQLVRR